MATACSSNSSHLASVTVKQAAEALARRAVAVRAGGGGRTKSAAGFAGEALNAWAPQFANQAKDRLAAHAGRAGAGDAFSKLRGWWGGLEPWQQSGIQGAGLGALGGGVLGAATADEDDERHPFSAALTGALAGGALGAGGHAAYRAIDQYRHPPAAEKYERIPLPKPSEGGGGYTPPGSTTGVDSAGRPRGTTWAAGENVRSIEQMRVEDAKWRADNPKALTTEAPPRTKEEQAAIKALYQKNDWPNRLQENPLSPLRPFRHPSQTWQDARSDPSGEADRFLGRPFGDAGGGLGGYAWPWGYRFYRDVLARGYDAARRRAADPNTARGLANLSDSPDVLRAAARQVGETPGSPITAEQGAALEAGGASDANLRYFAETMRRGDQTAAQLGKRVTPVDYSGAAWAPGGEHPMEWQHVPAPRNSFMRTVLPRRVAGLPIRDTITSRPEPTLRPVYGGGPTQAGVNPENFAKPVPGGFIREGVRALQEEAGEGAVPRAAWYKPFGGQPRPTFEEPPWYARAPRPWGEMGTLGRAGRVGGVLLPVGLNILQNIGNHSGRTPAEDLNLTQNLDPTGALRQAAGSY